MDGHQNLAAAPGRPKLLDQVRNVIRRLHGSIRTEQAYVDWVRRFILYLIKAGLPRSSLRQALPGRFILFHGKRYPAEMGAPEVEAFLAHLAVQAKVAASTQPAKVGTVFSASDAWVMGGSLR